MTDGDDCRICTHLNNRIQVKIDRASIVLNNINGL